VGWATPLAVTGGITYAIFMLTSLITGKLGG
jgi:hypothetical protein